MNTNSAPYKDITAEEALNHIRIDLDMLENGEWIPDSQSIGTTRDMLIIIENALKETI